MKKNLFVVSGFMIVFFVAFMSLSACISAQEAEVAEEAEYKPAESEAAPEVEMIEANSEEFPEVKLPDNSGVPEPIVYEIPEKPTDH